MVGRVVNVNVSEAEDLLKRPGCKRTEIIHNGKQISVITKSLSFIQRIDLLFSVAVRRVCSLFTSTLSQEETDEMWASFKEGRIIFEPPVNFFKTTEKTRQATSKILEVDVNQKILNDIPENIRKETELAINSIREVMGYGSSDKEDHLSPQAFRANYEHKAAPSIDLFFDKNGKLQCFQKSNSSIYMRKGDSFLTRDLDDDQLKKLEDFKKNKSLKFCLGETSFYNISVRNPRAQTDPNLDAIQKGLFYYGNKFFAGADFLALANGVSIGAVLAQPEEYPTLEIWKKGECLPSAPFSWLDKERNENQAEEAAFAETRRKRILEIVTPSSSKGKNIDDLPSEVLLQIFENLPLTDQKSLSQVSTQMAQIERLLPDLKPVIQETKRAIEFVRDVLPKLSKGQAHNTSMELFFDSQGDLQAYSFSNQSGSSPIPIDLNKEPETIEECIPIGLTWDDHKVNIYPAGSKDDLRKMKNSKIILMGLFFHANKFLAGLRHLVIEDKQSRDIFRILSESDTILNNPKKYPTELIWEKAEGAPFPSYPVPYRRKIKEGNFNTIQENHEKSYLKKSKEDFSFLDQ